VTPAQQQNNGHQALGDQGSMLNPEDDMDLILDSVTPYASTFVAPATNHGQVSAESVCFSPPSLINSLSDKYACMLSDKYACRCAVPHQPWGTAPPASNQGQLEKKLSADPSLCLSCPILLGWYSFGDKCTFLAVRWKVCGQARRSLQPLAQI
jgi:hypothetical protein